jgi:heptaprenyl diphosphate synthase
MMTALATILASVESLIQPPVPFLRLGLANGVTLLALKWMGFKEGIFIAAARVLLASLILGRLFQPSFFLSLSGSLLAALVMGLMIRRDETWFSLIGISVAGAFFHNLAQIIVASLMIGRFIGFSMIPLFFLTSLAAGILIGYFTILIQQRYHSVFPLQQ